MVSFLITADKCFNVNSKTKRNSSRIVQVVKAASLLVVMSLIPTKINRRAICIVENSINILARRLSPRQEQIASCFGGLKSHHTMSGATSRMRTISNFPRKANSLLEKREILDFVSHRPSSSLNDGKCFSFPRFR